MRRLFAAVICLSALPAFAGSVEHEIESRWLGAWVVTTVEGHSDCLSGYANNTVNGRLVKSRAPIPFRAGELSRVDKVDAKRNRVDFHLSLVEPVLLPYADGPFTLFREATCRIEYQIELPGKTTPDLADRALLTVLERYESEGEAETSAVWNRRVRDPYPDDYERTVAEHAVWQAENVNRAVQARIDAAVDETARLRDRIEDDPEYLSAFARGVRETRGKSLSSCPAMLGYDLAAGVRHSSRPHPPTPAERGFADGVLLSRGTELIRNLPGCFVPVPAIEVASR